jgi:hypothetical protein
MFRALAQDVVNTTSISCAVPIPPPPGGRAVDFSRLALVYLPSAAAPVQLTQVTSPTSCHAGAFYLESARIVMCPDTCAQVRADTTAAVNVLFACESTIAP